MDLLRLFDTGLCTGDSGVFAFLGVADVASVEATCTRLRTVQDDHALWRLLARRTFSTKRFVPELCQRLTEHEGTTVENRVDLKKKSNRELLRLCQAHQLDTRVYRSFTEKSEFIRYISEHETRRKRSGEALSKFALRAAVADRHRTRITLEELVSIEKWDIRVRCDGPLRHLMPYDPWWAKWLHYRQSDSFTLADDRHARSDPFGEHIPEAELRHLEVLEAHLAGRQLHQLPMQFAKFERNGMVFFHGPPFEQMLQGQGIGWTLGAHGIDLHPVGVTERVGRHPEHWGWILTSNGSLWTSWEHPTPEEVDRREEAWAWEGKVDRLLGEGLTDGFQW